MTANPRKLTMPILQRSLALKKIEYEADDELFERILHDIGRLIGKSEQECAEASTHQDQDLAEYVYEAEAEYIEELIGSAFLVMQTKIRRVTETTKKLEAALKRGGGDETQEFANDGTIRATGGSYRDTPKSLVAIVWAFGNYYKHRDEWASNVWIDGHTTAKKQSVNTRETVQLAGVEQTGSGNMRKGFEFLEVTPYSACIKLGKQVQSWARDVFDVAEKAAAAAKLKD